MDNKWIVIGITGVTCGGKTTLSKKLTELIKESLSAQNVDFKVISQDDYFLDVDDKRHTWVEELQHIHFDIITSMDMEKMFADISNIIGRDGNKLIKSADAKNIKANKKTSIEKINEYLKNIKNINILILEGFSIFEHEDIYKICHLKYFFTLDYEECKKRRLLRTYEPPDCDGYFEICVWPEYIKYLKLVEEKNLQLHDVTFYESKDIDRIYFVALDLVNYLS